MLISYIVSRPGVEEGARAGGGGHVARGRCFWRLDLEYFKGANSMVRLAGSYHKSGRTSSFCGNGSLSVFSASFSKMDGTAKN